MRVLLSTCSAFNSNLNNAEPTDWSRWFRHLFVNFRPGNSGSLADRQVSRNVPYVLLHTFHGPAQREIVSLCATCRAHLVAPEIFCVLNAFSFHFLSLHQISLSLFRFCLFIFALLPVNIHFSSSLFQSSPCPVSLSLFYPLFYPFSWFLCNLFYIDLLCFSFFSFHYLSSSVALNYFLHLSSTFQRYFFCSLFCFFQYFPSSLQLLFTIISCFFLSILVLSLFHLPFLAFRTPSVRISCITDL